MRLIDADALANYANNQIGGITANDIMRFPTIDAEPVKHARWVETSDWYHGILRIYLTCSNCGYTVEYKSGSRGDGRGGKFCDDCGAKMDGDTNDET